MTDDRIEILDLLKQELVATWAYLHGYAELFEHPDQRRVQLLEETAPGFFALAQSALAESVLIRLVRLMDPPESGKNKSNQNLSFGRLFYPCADNPDLTEAKAQFGEICSDWEGSSSKYRSLKSYRNHVHGHNDLPTIKGAPPWVTSKLEVEDVQLLRDLFCRLWQVLKSAYSVLKETSLGEPRYGKLEQSPTAIFRYLVMGHNAMTNYPELGGLPEPEFDGVGNDKSLQITT